MKKPMRVYISGKITGLPPAEAAGNFGEAQDMITRKGHMAINPMSVSFMLPGFDWITYMTIAYGILRGSAIDAIYMLKGWEKSRGAVIEWGWAQAKGLKVLYQNPADYAKYGGVQ